MVGNRNVRQRELTWIGCGIFNIFKSIIIIHHLLTFTPFSPGSPFAPSGPSGPGRPLSPCENQKVETTWRKTCEQLTQALSKEEIYNIPDPLSSLEYPESVKTMKQRRLIISLNGENPSKSKIFSLLTLLPDSPRAPSLPWEQTGSTAHSPQLGNSLHHIMKQTVMKSRSC